MVWGFCCNGARIFRFDSGWAVGGVWVGLMSQWAAERICVLCVCLWTHQWIAHKYYRLENTHTHGVVDRERTTWLRLAEIVSKDTFAFPQNVSLSKCISLGGWWARHKDIDRPIKITIVDCEWHVKEEIRRCSHSYFNFRWNFIPREIQLVKEGIYTLVNRLDHKTVVR